MKKLTIVSAVLAAGLIVSGCSKMDATYSDSNPETTSEAQDNLPVPEEVAATDRTYIAKNAVWDQKNTVETALAVDGSRLDFTEAGTLKYTDTVKPAEGQTLYGLTFKRTHNTAYTENSPQQPEGIYTYAWSGDMEPIRLDIPEGADSGIVVFSAPSNATVELHGVMAGSPDQVVELPSGERTTPDIGKAFYAEHAGFVGEANDPDLNGSLDRDVYVEGEIGQIRTSFTNDNREAIQDGNVINILIDFESYPTAFNDSIDENLSVSSVSYELSGAGGKTYKGEAESSFSGDVRFSVPVVESSYTLTMKMKGEFFEDNMTTSRGSWEHKITRDITF